MRKYFWVFTSKVFFAPPKCIKMDWSMSAVMRHEWNGNWFVKSKLLTKQPFRSYAVSSMLELLPILYITSLVLLNFVVDLIKIKLVFKQVGNYVLNVHCTLSTLLLVWVNLFCYMVFYEVNIFRDLNDNYD